MGKQPLIAALDRPLELDELELLEERATKAPALRKLTERHHRLARALAEGMSETEAAIVVGYSVSRISILKDDPSFKDLVAHYAEQVQERFADLQDRLSALAATAVDELNDRLEISPEDFSNDDLRKLAALAADRTGHGPTSTSTHNVNIGLAERLDAARVRRRPSEDIIEAEELCDDSLDED